MKKRILIIGGDSYIAGKLIKVLQENCELVIISRKATNLPNEIIHTNLFELPINYYKDVDTIINFAAIVHQPKLKDDTLYEQVNHQLPLHLAKQAQQAEVKHFIQLSSIAVYGNASNISNDTEENPDNAYGISKLKADQELWNLSNDDFIISTIRPPMVYGGGLAPGNMLKLIRLVNRKLPLPFKNLDNKRSFINVTNLVNFLFEVINKRSGGVFVPSDKDGVSTEELIRIIASGLNINCRLFSIPNFLLKLISRITPGVYSKLFGSLEISYLNKGVSGNYQTATESEGILEMVKSLNEK